MPYQMEILSDYGRQVLKNATVAALGVLSMGQYIGSCSLQIENEELREKYQRALREMEPREKRIENTRETGVSDNTP